MAQIPGSSPPPDGPAPGDADAAAPAKRPSKRRVKAGTGKPAGKAAGKAAAKATGKSVGKAAAKRPPSRKTFLVAATVPNGEGRDHVCVYAAVTRTPEDALAAVRAVLGADMPVEFTGKLSGRMAKALGLTADEVRRI